MTPEGNTALLLVLLAMAVAAFVLLRRASNARARKDRAWTYPDYLEGLHHLLRGRKDEAARAFRAAVESGPYALEARLRLGDLLRARGAVEQATRLHQSILAIPGSPAALHRDAAIALADDFRAAGKTEAAVDVIQRALAALGNEEQLLLRLLRALEESGRWDRALEVARSLEKLSAHSARPRAALYRVERAQDALVSGNVRRARADIRKALVDDPKCGPARLLSGDVFLQLGEKDKAVAEWLRLADEVPELADLAYSRIERALYDAGEYGRILEIYDTMLQKRPGDVETLCRLALYDERIGSLEKAVERAQQAVDAAPSASFPRALMAAFLCDLGRAEEASVACREIARLSGHGLPQYRCPHCGAPSAEFVWRCPACARIGAFVRSAPA
ncbi:MAG: tetratricopeptide repeat protein [Candidatus Eisenbacteria bacterium]|jgi:lipopolysaccharide biosynthesis regulator YciM|nr:tetratricopeptide repeat protein [Candidatus Eisenbacteria bacterium]